jgi:hypothetical protein
LRRSVYETLGSPTEELGPSWDLDYCWQAHEHGITLQFVPDAVVHYRLRDDFLSRYRQARAWGRSHAVVVRKYGTVTSLQIARHLASSGRRMANLARHMGPVIARRRTMTYWAWEFGWCVGYLRGVRHLIGVTGPARAAKSLGEGIHNCLMYRHFLVRAPFYSIFGLIHI